MTTTEDTIKSILETAVYAPSGDNSQPWQFRIENNLLKIFNLPKRDNEIFNYEQRGSFIAHGALIENIKILAGNKNLDAKISLFPNATNPNQTAEIEFTINNGLEKNPLADVIKERSTNRKKYFSTNLTEQQKQVLLESAKENGNCKLIFLEDSNSKKLIGEAASSAERIMLEYKPLHDAFFRLLVWNNENKIGMNVATMELQPPQKLIFRLFKYWAIDRIFSFFKIPAVVSIENSKTYAQCSAIGGILIPSLSKEDFIETGRLLQRVWLKATALNLSMQPIAGILYLEQSLKHGNMPGLQQKWQNLINKSKNTIYQSFKVQNEELVMIFRIGTALERPSAKSIKLAPEILK